MAIYSRDEFEELVETSGFRIEAMYGDYDYSGFDPETSPSMIYVLQLARKGEEKCKF
jgi:hypothetical protein